MKYQIIQRNQTTLNDWYCHLVLNVLPKLVDEEVAQFYLHPSLSEMKTVHYLICGFDLKPCTDTVTVTRTNTVTVTFACDNELFCSSLRAGLQAWPPLAPVCPELQCWAMLPDALAEVNLDLAIYWTKRIFIWEIEKYCTPQTVPAASASASFVSLNSELASQVWPPLTSIGPAVQATALQCDCFRGQYYFHCPWQMR